MDQYAVSFLLLEESAIFATHIGLVIAGGIIGAMLLDVQIRLRRVAYLWFIALLSLALTLVQFFWFFTPAAAEAGLLWLLLATSMGAFVLFGVGLYYASAARSRDIRGNTDMGWLGFVPFANLWLVFTPGGAHDIVPAGAPRSPFARFVLDPILVIGALVVVLGSNAANRVAMDMPPRPSDSPALAELTRGAQTLEERFAREARLTRADLPIRIDEITLLSGIEAQA